MPEFVTVTQAIKMLGVARPTVCEWCESGKLRAKKVEDNTRYKFHWEIEKNDCYRKLADKYKPDISTDQQTTINQEEDLEKKIASLNLPHLEADRLKAVLSGFSKPEADRVLKTEQALAELRENVLQDGLYVEKSKINSQIGEVFSLLLRSLKDLISVWQKRYEIEEDNVACMLFELEKVLKSAIEGMGQ